MIRSRKPRLGRWQDWLVGTLLLTAVLILVESTLGWSAVLAPWATLPPWLLITAFLLTAASYLLRAVRVRVYFQTELAGRFPALLRLSVLHNSANNLLPMRAGEMVFPWLMRRYFGHGFWAAGASLIWIRLLDLHFLGMIGVVVLWTRAPSPWWGLLVLGWLGLLPLFWLAGRLLQRTGADGAEGRLQRLLRVVAAAAPRERGQVLRLYRWTALSWSLKFVAFALILGHFVPAALWQLVLGVMGAELSTVLPFHGIAGSGSFELAAVAAMVPLGVAPAQALAGAVNLHLFLLGTTLVLGATALLIPVSIVDPNFRTPI